MVPGDALGYQTQGTCKIKFEDGTGGRRRQTRACYLADYRTPPAIIGDDGHHAYAPQVFAVLDSMKDEAPRVPSDPIPPAAGKTLATSKDLKKLRAAAFSSLKTTSVEARSDRCDGAELPLLEPSQSSMPTDRLLLAHGGSRPALLATIRDACRDAWKLCILVNVEDRAARGETVAQGVPRYRLRSGSPRGQGDHPRVLLQGRRPRELLGPRRRRFIRRPQVREGRDDS